MDLILKNLDMARSDGEITADVGIADGTIGAIEDDRAGDPFGLGRFLWEVAGSRCDTIGPNGQFAWRCATVSRLFAGVRSILVHRLYRRFCRRHWLWSVCEYLPSRLSASATRLTIPRKS